MNVSELKATRKGKVVLRKGLKIVHSPTGLEYTVADIFKDESGKLRIRLSPPESPRIAPIAGNQVISEELPPVSPEAEDAAIVDDQQSEEIELDDEDVLVLDQEELKDYEVR